MNYKTKYNTDKKAFRLVQQHERIRWNTKSIFPFIYFASIVLVFCINTNAQNLSFSQRNYSPIQINPGSLSSLNDIKATAIYRNENFIGDLSYQCYQFSAFSPLFIRNQDIRLGGMGVSVFSDKADSEGLMKTNGVALAYAQNIKITPNSHLSLGLLGTYYQKRLNTDGFTTGSQWLEYSGFDPDSYEGEPFNNEALDKFSVGTGLYWFLLDEMYSKKAFAGFSLFHLNRPNESFTEFENTLPIEYSFIGGYRAYQSQLIEITPDIYYQNKEYQQIFTLGTNFKLKFTNESPHIPLKSGSVELLTRYAIQNAFIIGIQLHQPGFSFGISYDGASRSNKTAAAGGITEIGISIIKPLFNKPPKEIPSENIYDYEIGEIREQKLDTEKEVVIIYKEKLPEEDIFIKEDSLKFNFKLEKDFKYAFGDATLNDEAKEFLDEIYRLLQRNKYLQLEIIGHTDNVGTDEANQILSEKRANAVQEYLISKGIVADRISAIGKADKEPAYPNTTPESRAKNRRVEFIITME